MQKLLFLILLFASAQIQAQNNFLALEKDSINVTTYSTGSYINIETVYHQWLEGTITELRNDSVFIDGNPFHYKEIASIRVARKKFHSTKFGAFMMAAGAGVMVLGAVNGLYRGDPTNKWYTATSYITAGSLLLGGYLLTIGKNRTFSIGTKYTLRFVTIDFNKKP